MFPNCDSGKKSTGGNRDKTLYRLITKGRIWKTQDPTCRVKQAVLPPKLNHAYDCTIKVGAGGDIFHSKSCRFRAILLSLHRSHNSQRLVTQ